MHLGNPQAVARFLLAQLLYVGVLDDLLFPIGKDIHRFRHEHALIRFFISVVFLADYIKQCNRTAVRIRLE